MKVIDGIREYQLIYLLIVATFSFLVLKLTPKFIIEDTLLQPSNIDGTKNFFKSHLVILL